jgi:hypothetical protein
MLRKLFSKLIQDPRLFLLLSLDTFGRRDVYIEEHT